MQSEVAMKVKLSANENFYGSSPKVKEAIRAHIGSESVYPDHAQQELKQKIAAKWGVDSSNIMLGVGCVGLIDSIINYLTKPDEEILSFERSFIAYEMFSKLHNRNYHLAKLIDYREALDNLLPLINEKTKLIFIANPNNPTGTIITHEEVEEFLKKIPKEIFVVLDEAYFEYVSDESFPRSIELLARYKNVIILRGFSKIYGLAGMRIGYGIANTETISFMESIRVPFNINTFASIAANAAIEDSAFVTDCHNKNAIEREFLYHEISKLGFSVLKSQGNFLYAYFNDDSRKDEVHKHLENDGLMVCNMKVFGQDKSLRITVADRATNVRLIESLTNIGS